MKFHFPYLCKTFSSSALNKGLTSRKPESETVQRRTVLRHASNDAILIIWLAVEFHTIKYETSIQRKTYGWKLKHLKKTEVVKIEWRNNKWKLGDHWRSIIHARKKTQCLNGTHICSSKGEQCVQEAMLEQVFHTWTSAAPFTSPLLIDQDGHQVFQVKGEGCPLNSHFVLCGGRE